MMIEILGERKTGTNYTKRMIKMNFDVNVVVYGWKHRIIKEGADCNYIVCIRHPYQWLKSLYSKPYHMEYMAGKTFSEFLHTHARDFTGEKYNNCMAMWNKKHKAYLELAKTHKVYFLLHENVLKDWRKEFQNIALFFNIKPKSKLTNIEKTMNDLGMVNKKFKEKKYFTLSQSDKRRIDNIIDNKILKGLGY